MNALYILNMFLIDAEVLFPFNCVICNLRHSLQHWKKLLMILNGLDQASRSAYNQILRLLPLEVKAMEIYRYYLFPSYTRHLLSWLQFSWSIKFVMLADRLYILCQYWSHGCISMRSSSILQVWLPFVLLFNVHVPFFTMLVFSIFSGISTSSFEQQLQTFPALSLKRTEEASWL